MSADQVLEWARKMGYPDVDNPEFQENVRRLIVPQTKPIWRHLTECVRPADEASNMKKQLLCYKVSVEGNPTQETLEKFDNVMEYEFFLKKKTLEAKIQNLNQQIEQKKKQIEFTCVKKLSESEDRKRADAVLEKEKIEKLRLLRLKNEELRANVKQFEDLSSIAAEFRTPRYTCPLKDEELSQFVSSLEPGREVEQMCSHLSSTIRTLADFIQSERRSSLSLEGEKMSLHRDMDEQFSQMSAKMEELRNKRNKLEAELDEKKREFSEPANLDLAQRVKASFIQTGRLNALIASEKQKFLKSWIAGNIVPIADDPSICSEPIANVELSLSQAHSNLKYYNTFPASQLRSSLAEYVKKTRTEASKCPRRDVAVEADRILSGLPQLISNFLKTPNILSNITSSVAAPNPVRHYSNLKSAQFQKCLADKFPQLELAVRHNFPEPVALLYSIESSVARQKNKVHDLFNEIETLTRQLDDLFESTASLLNNWSKYPIHAVLPHASEFHDSIEKVEFYLGILNLEERNLFIRKFNKSTEL